MYEKKTIGKRIGKVVDKVSEKVENVKDKITTAKEGGSVIARDISKSVKKAVNDSSDVVSGLLKKK